MIFGIIKTSLESYVEFEAGIQGRQKYLFNIGLLINKPLIRTLKVISFERLILFVIWKYFYDSYHCSGFVFLLYDFQYFDFNFRFVRVVGALWLFILNKMLLFVLLFWLNGGLFQSFRTRGRS